MKKYMQMTRWVVSALPLFLWLGGAAAIYGQGQCQSTSDFSVVSPCIPSGYIVQVSEILTPYSQSIVGYTAVEISVGASYYYGSPAVTGQIYQGSTLVAQGSMWGGSGFNGNHRLASLQLSTPWVSAATFTMTGIGSVAFTQQDTCYDPNQGYYVDCYEDPANLAGEGYWSEWNWANLPVVYWTVDTTPPNILSIVNCPQAASCPASGGAAGLTVNSSGTIAINGAHLTGTPPSDDPLLGSAPGDDPNPVITRVPTNAGLSLTQISSSENQIVLGYSASAAAAPGTYMVSVKTYAGTSNTYSITLGDPTPMISALNPSTWNAGTATPFTISGTGFGTNPQVSVTGSGIASYAIVPAPAPTDSLIYATVSVASNAPAGNPTVTVTSNGYGGSGFQQTQTGQPQSGSLNATIVPIVAPSAPYILFGTTSCALGPQNVANTTQSVYVGQQIIVTGCAYPPGGYTVSSQSWAQPSGTVVGGYTASTASGSVVTFASANPSLAVSGLTFYWVDAGNGRHMTFTYTLNDGQSASATVTFNVAGPTMPNITAQLAPVKARLINGQPYMALDGIASPSASGTVGITLTATSTLPSSNPGAYSWAQLLNADHFNLLSNSGTTQACDAFMGGPVLDNTYPYGTPGGNLFTKSVANDVVTDGPRITLSSSFAEESRRFSATMFLLWNSSLPNAIPIPLASMTWGMTGDAINTLLTQSNGTNWALGCGQGTSNACHISNPTSDPSSGYPTWSQTYTNGSLICH